MLAIIRAGLVKSINARLVDELLEAYTEAKRNYYLGGLRLSAVEGGRFSEAAFRILEEKTTGTFTSLSKKLDTDKTITRLASLPSHSYHESIRLHIPRALRVVYDIRNNRDAAHLADGIDPNTQDATLVASVIDWVMAEFVRLYHAVSADEARRIVETLVTRRAPAVQDFDGFLKVLNPKLPAGDHFLLLLYQRGEEGATSEELDKWARPPMRANLKKTLDRLVHDKSFVHLDAGRYVITESGLRDVEKRRLYDLPE